MSHASNPDLLVTPDGRYFVVKGRLWRMSNPALDPSTRQRLVEQLMKARRDVAAALRAKDASAQATGRSRVHRAKVALGERGPPWWPEADGNHNQRLVSNTPYAAWYKKVKPARKG